MREARTPRIMERVMAVDTSGWTFVGETRNTRYFWIEPGALAAVPHPGCIDSPELALENTLFQNDQLRKSDGGGVMVIFFDHMSSQDKETRRVYQSTPDQEVFHGAALVGGTLLARAMGSFFMGIAKPRIPTKMFPTVAEALVWARALNAAARGRATAGGAAR